nr:FecR domain-containing protein [Kiritimatiellia bacterium]
IWGMTELTFLDLSNNNLTGTLPNTVNQLTKLTALNLQGNNFNGEIPALSLPLLEWLNLDNNGFSGEVPETIWTMTKLSNLSLRNNNLSGEIPNNVNQLINLEFLSISDNSFEGELPDISLPKLRYLELNNNEFTGTVPTPPNVETRNLRGNNFHGLLPDDLLENGNLLILDIFDNAFNAWQFLPDWQDDISALQNIGVTINTANQRYREVGLVTLYTGIVQIRRWNTDFHETEIFNVSPGMKIFEGDEIRTGVSSGVDIKFIDGSFMTLGNKSSFLVERYTDRRTKPTIFRFLEGIIENFTSGEPDYYEYLREQNKKPLYIINKRGGASGVRGTIFSMRYETIDEIEYQIIDMSEGIVDVYDITTGQVTSVSGTDTLQNPVEISEGVKAIHFWIDIAGLLDENTGILSKPFGKNITNLEKLASNLKLHKADNKRLTFGSNEASGTHATQIEQLSPNSRRISVEFLRRTDIQELSYAPMYSTNLTGDWVPFDVPVSVTPIDFNWEKVRCEVVLSDINSPIFTAILYQYD